jgi:UDP-N-acetyl-D-mannosaminuronic acid dehydrogenase
MAVAMALREADLTSPEERERHNIALIGCGKVGLAMACLFSEADFRVTCFSPDPYLAKQINEGTGIFDDSELNRMLKRNLTRGRLRATTDPKEAVSGSDIILLAADIPIDGKKRPVYTSLEAICRIIGLSLQPGSLIIVQSPVAPSITEGLIIESLERASGLEAGVDFGLAYSPVGYAADASLSQLKEHSRIIAAINDQSVEAAKALLRTVTNGELVEVSNIKAAEAAALFGDIYRDVCVALSNELASFCERAGIDYVEARRAANKQPFCHLFYPSLDGGAEETPYFLISEAETMGLKLRITALARRMNREASRQVYNLIKDAIHSCEKTVKRSKIAVLGVSSRPNLREARGSQLLDLIRLLRKRGGRISVFDPNFTYKELSQLGYPAEKTLGKTLERADCLLIAVGHEKFRNLRLSRIKAMMRKPPVIVDLAHIIDPAEAEREGFIYRGLGRGVWSR